MGCTGGLGGLLGFPAATRAGLFRYCARRARRRGLDIGARERSKTPLDRLENDQRSTAGFDRFVHSLADQIIDPRPAFAGRLFGLLDREGKRLDAVGLGRNEESVAGRHDVLRIGEDIHIRACIRKL